MKPLDPDSPSFAAKVGLAVSASTRKRIPMAKLEWRIKEPGHLARHGLIIELLSERFEVAGQRSPLFCVATFGAREEGEP
jgi:hypothetical protein